jgi:hypothetical protein
VRFVATAERDNKGLTTTGEANPVSGAVVDLKLRYRPTGGLRIAWVASSHAADPANDVKDGALILQGSQPAGELRCFANFDTDHHVIHRLRSASEK